MSVLRLSRLFFVLAVVGMAALLLLSTPRVTAYTSHPSAAPFGVVQVGNGEAGSLQGDITVTEPQNVELLSQFGGVIHSMAVSGTYAYVGIGPRVVVFDVHDPAQPQLVWQSEIMLPALPRQGGHVAVHGNRLYVSQGGRFIIFDLTNPANPVELGSSATPLWEFVISGHYVYGFNQGLQIFDVSNPAAPVLVGSYHMEEVYQFAVAGNYVYVGGTHADEPNGVVILDVSDPSSPAQVAFYYTEGTPDDLAVYGEHLYVLNPSGTPDLVIVDVSVPTDPRLAGTFSSPECGSQALSVIGGYAYIAGAGICILDISDPASPEQVAHLFVPGNGWAMTVVDDYAYITDRSTNLQIVDVSQPDAPEIAGAIYSPDYPKDLVVTGTHAYLVAGKLFILDVSDPGAPSQEAVYDEHSHLTTINVTGKYAYVSPAVTSTQILDVSDPNTPAVVGSYPVSARDIAISGTHAYVTTGGYEFVTLDVSDPVSPTFVSSFLINGPSEKVEVSGARAYVTDREDRLGDPPGFSALDITNPSAPTYVGGFPAARVEDFDVVGDYVYLAGGPILSIRDFSDPAAPILVGSILFPYSGELQAVEVVGDYAYVAAGSAGLRVVNVANPAAPCHVGSFPSDNALNVAVSGGYVYVADAFAGLLVLRHDAPDVPSLCPVLYLPLLHNR
jgi:hypothetical protein